MEVHGYWQGYVQEHSWYAGPKLMLGVPHVGSETMQHILLLSTLGGARTVRHSGQVSSSFTDWLILCALLQLRERTIDLITANGTMPCAVADVLVRRVPGPGGSPIEVRC
jgi:hypothetical protein